MVSAPENRNAEKTNDLAPKDISPIDETHPPDKNDWDKQLIRRVVTNINKKLKTEANVHHGIPSPSILAEYEKIYPGFVKQYMDRQLSSLKHVQELERYELLEPFKYARRGQLLGFLIMMGSFGAAGWCAYLNEPIVASIFGLSGLLPIIRLFLQNPPTSRAIFGQEASIGSISKKLDDQTKVLLSLLNFNVKDSEKQHGENNSSTAGKLPSSEAPVLAEPVIPPRKPRARSPRK